MANEISIKFGSFTFDTTNHISIGNIRISPAKSISLKKIPKNIGSITEEADLENITIELEGDIEGTNVDDLRSNLDAFKAALTGIQKFTLDDDRYIKTQCSKFDHDFKNLKRIAKWKATFKAHYPIWLSETLSTDERIPTSGSGYTINNPGNAPTRVKIEVTAPAGGITDNCQIENTTLGEICKYRGTIAATKKLEIDNRVDTDEFEVLNDGTDDIANFEGDFITLAAGNNTIEYTGTAGATVKLSYRAAYY